MFKWSLFIDIEGFSNLFGGPGTRAKAQKLLSGLMEDILKIGRQIYGDDSKRLFAYQFGDGFSIHPDFPEKLDRPIAIAVALMRLTVARDGLARALLSEGEMADRLGCFPREIMNRMAVDNTVGMGDGLMTVNPVMGEGLINAYGLSKHKPKGPRLLLDKRLWSATSPLDVSTREYTHTIAVDWIYSKVPLADRIISGIGYTPLSSDELDAKVRSYLRCNSSLPAKVRKNIKNVLRKKYDVRSCLLDIVAKIRRMFGSGETTDS